MSTATGASLDLGKCILATTPHSMGSLKERNRTRMTFSATSLSSTVVFGKCSLSQIVVDRHLAVNSKKNLDSSREMMVRVGADRVGTMSKCAPW